MKLSSSDIERNLCQFDCLAKKVLREYARDIYREYANRVKRECTFSDLTYNDNYQLYIEDEYNVVEAVFDVMGRNIVVKGAELIEALEQLPRRRRNIILLSYFLNLTDREIGELLNLQRATVQYNRSATLRTLKTIVKEI